MMLGLGEIVAVGLAAYRVGHMLAREDGPFDLFSSLRERVGQKTWMGRGMHCALCTSFWLPWPLLLLWLWAGLPGQLIVAGLAAAGVGLAIHGVIHAEQ